ncbi:hypothetical protein M8J76_004690 [Diaphorina citri]|nr:hypothetical protein M8J75_000735 [Diaphorina citri]KAI5723348.1 hypothetical protein M8J76_004690 [Diaphorina citri]KAI5727892.1 hypothetical protein M8J77_008286 [Diaphorina citri]
MDLLDSDGSRENVLTAQIDNVKKLTTILKALHFKEKAILYPSQRGLKVIVQDAKCMQAAAYIYPTLFQVYEVNINNSNDESGDTVMFQIPFIALLQCLTIFDGCSNTPGATSTLKMTYRGYGHPLNLILEEEGVLTDCQIRTQEAIDVLNFVIRDDEMSFKIIMKALELKLIFAELDSSSEYIELKMSSEPQNMKIVTRGDSGMCEVCISSSSEFVDIFRCDENLSFRYTYAQFKPIIKFLQVAIKANLRGTSEGLLCFHFVICLDMNSSQERQYNYIEYFCTAAVDDD